MSTTTRPTPEQIIMGVQFCDVDLLDRFRDHGYVIVHRSDVPDADLASTGYRRGWNDCVHHIFSAALA